MQDSSYDNTFLKQVLFVPDERCEGRHALLKQLSSQQIFAKRRHMLDVIHQIEMCLPNTIEVIMGCF